MQLTNADIKLVKGLDSGRHRRESGLFKVEGTKAVVDTLGAFRLNALYATAEWLDEHPLPHGIEATPVAAKAVERMSSMSTPQGVVAVYHLPEYGDFDPVEAARAGLILALDAIQDPGNLGTIIRTADWFGVRDIICSAGTADAFGPKVVQATMGAFTRVRVHYLNLAQALGRIVAEDLPVYGTFLDGEDINRAELGSNGVIVIGNEGRGVSAEVAQAVTRRLFIPPYPPEAATVESLNAAVATAVVLARFRAGC